jgi:hypothetical protein
MAQKRFLSSIELPEVTDLDSNPIGGFKRLYASADRLQVKDSTGAEKSIWFEDKFSSANESNPVYTYTLGDITRIDYASGNYKLFTYSSGNLTQLDFVKGSVTYRKTFIYDTNSNLTSIVYSVL